MEATGDTDSKELKERRSNKEGWDCGSEAEPLPCCVPGPGFKPQGETGGRAEKNRSEAHHSDREMGDSIRGLGKSEGPY